ncbi:DAR GTPase 2, mitochondrial-like [Phragmites australis]|uniref:DAR GTPase 2, mitochondrial-like n=1 Tax=Phragmites australis TaxID=29695 RepID=UPI002D78B46A|nr:DAR GTPase 2, mitochondrial-like [Phragmites australis]
MLRDSRGSASSPSAMATEALSRRLGAAVRGLCGAWYGRHMAAADRAIRARLPLVDLVLEVRDARVPASSAFEPLRRRALERDSRRVVVLNKADLADPSETEKWVAYMKQRSCPCVAVNSHSRESIKELLSVVRSRIREIKLGESDCAGTVLLVGIPNVGKSAIVNAMHQIGRIGAAEKGKLKHAIVSSHPGETRDISGYKVASHPNIYVLDTPGVLSPRFVNDDSGSRLALTGAIKDSLLEDYDTVQFLLAIVNSRGEYRKWENLNQMGDHFSCGNAITSTSHKKRQYVSDHTQDFIVKAVRQVLFETISSFKGGLGEEDGFRRLIDCQFVSLQEAFKVSTESSEDVHKHVAMKILNLYRTGRLGHYTLDHVPDVRQEDVA